MQVSRETLTLVPNSRLAKLVSDIVDPKGNEVFIDRDLESFKLMISYLRYNRNLPKIEDPFLRYQF